MLSFFRAAAGFPDCGHPANYRPRNPAATNLTYTVEVCDDLAAGVWQPGANPPEIDTPTRLRVRDTVTAGTAPHRFIRLRVEVKP